MLIIYIFLFLLVGYVSEIMTTLQKIHHRMDYQYDVQNYMINCDRELQNARSVQEKKETLDHIEQREKREIKNCKRDIIHHLNEIKKINSKNFTGKISTELRCYALNEGIQDTISTEPSFISRLFRFFLICITSSKNDTDITLFQMHATSINYGRIMLWSLENYPNYASPYWSDLQRDTSPRIDYSMEMNERTIKEMINKYSN